MKDNTTDVEQRVTRYWFKDGIGELAGGGLFVVLGLFFAGNEWLPPNSLARTLLDSGLILLLISGVFITRWLINLLKTHLTYPRTGYIEYFPSKKNTPSRRTLTAVIAMSVSILMVLFGRVTDSFNWLPGFTGLAVGVILIMTQAQSGGRKFYILGVFSIILGFALSFSDLSEVYSLGLFYGLTGVAAIISGGLTLAFYLRENPMPAEGINER
jgi:hypothetical protein